MTDRLIKHYKKLGIEITEDQARKILEIDRNYALIGLPNFAAKFADYAATKNRSAHSPESQYISENTAIFLKRLQESVKREESIKSMTNEALADELLEKIWADMEIYSENADLIEEACERLRSA